MQLTSNGRTISTGITNGADNSTVASDELGHSQKAK